MTGFVYDWSFQAPAPAALVAAGAAGYVGYVSTVDHRKNLTLELVRDLAGHGLAGALVHENGTGYQSWNPAGANDLADALGWPRDRPIYYTEDTDIDPGVYPAVYAALELAAHVGRPAGIYGESGLVQYANDRGVAFGWIAASSAWSHTPAPAAALRQLVGSPIAGTDRNDMLRVDYGQHPAPKPPPREDRMNLTYIRVGNHPDLAKRATVYVASIVTAPRPVRTFNESEFITAATGHVMVPPPAAAKVEQIPDLEHTVRPVWLVDYAAAGAFGVT